MLLLLLLLRVCRPLPLPQSVGISTTTTVAKVLPLISVEPPPSRPLPLIHTALVAARLPLLVALTATTLVRRRLLQNRRRHPHSHHTPPAQPDHLASHLHLLLLLSVLLSLFWPLPCCRGGQHDAAAGLDAPHGELMLLLGVLVGVLSGQGVSVDHLGRRGALVVLVALRYSGRHVDLCLLHQRPLVGHHLPLPRWLRPLGVVCLRLCWCGGRALRLPRRRRSSRVLIETPAGVRATG
mmetsp:Transcript_24394/g.70386  ORF Transcript_24394/g.70386 Transcript_24394/m.70386 type:complete len:238 (+) Transcript_24394:771-1484(+)